MSLAQSRVFTELKTVTGKQDTAPPEQELLLLSLPSYLPLLRIMNFKLGIKAPEPFFWCFNYKAHPAAIEWESRDVCDPEGAEPLRAAPIHYFHQWFLSNTTKKIWNFKEVAETFLATQHANLISTGDRRYRNGWKRNSPTSDFSLDTNVKKILTVFSQDPSPALSYQDPISCSTFWTATVYFYLGTSLARTNTVPSSVSNH